jgi:hypothetical protein
LWNFLNFSIEFAGGSLIKLHLLLQASSANGVQHAEDANTIGISGIFRHVKGYLNVTHGSQVVYFGWLDFRNDRNKIGRIAQVTIMQIQLHPRFMSITVNMIDTSGVETGGPTNDSMDLKNQTGYVREKSQKL